MAICTSIPGNSMSDGTRMIPPTPTAPISIPATRPSPTADPKIHAGNIAPKGTAHVVENWTLRVFWRL